MLQTSALAVVASLEVKAKDVADPKAKVTDVVSLKAKVAPHSARVAPAVAKVTSSNRLAVIDSMNAHQRIGILSDTHGYIDDQICKALATCDLIFHAGDIGSPQVLERLQAIAPTLAVYGNIDDAALHAQLPEVVHTEVAGVELVMTHIGGYPGHYERAFAPYLTPCVSVR